MTRYSSSAFLVLSNLFPIYGVYFLDWTFVPILFAYILETFIVIFFSGLKTYIATRSNPVGLLIGMLIFSIPNLFYGAFAFSWFIFFPGKSLDINSILITSVALFFSHLVSFLINFIGQKEYLHYFNEQAFSDQVLTRIGITHLTIWAGGIVFALVGFEIVGLVVFIFFKTAVDLKYHMKEHGLLEREYPGMVI